MKSQDFSGRNVVFIVGCPRSGTTWLQNLLAENKKVKTLGNESHLFDHYIGPLLRKWKEDKGSTQTSQSLATIIEEDMFVQSTRDYAHKLLRLDALNDDEIFVEKTPQHLAYLEEIIKLFPESKIVHIIRDPRDVVVSMLAASKSWGSEIADWKSATNAARRWVSLIRRIETSRTSVPESQFFELKYEDLLARTTETIQNLSNFLGLEWNEDLHTAVRKYDASTILRHRGTGEGTKYPKKGLRRGQSGTWKGDLSLVQKFQVWFKTRKMMKKFGYSWKYPWSQ